MTFAIVSTKPVSCSQPGTRGLRIIVQCHVTLSFGKVICSMIVVAKPSSVVCGWILAAPLRIHRARTTCPENPENLRAISFCHPTQRLCLLLVVFFCLVVCCCLMNLLATDPFFAFILILHHVNHLRLLSLRKITYLRLRKITMR